MPAHAANCLTMPYIPVQPDQTVGGEWIRGIRLERGRGGGDGPETRDMNAVDGIYFPLQPPPHIYNQVYYIYSTLDNQ